MLAKNGLQAALRAIQQHSSSSPQGRAKQQEKENACDMPLNETVHAVRVHAQVIVVLVSYRSKDRS